MKYDAFISYRHSPLDMEIAKKVHTALETYKVPKSVKAKIEKKKITRVFRDQEELPIGSNLSDNISEALSSSEKLIVICSPRTPESEWVGKEIDAFIKMHGRDNVLAVLIEGEPDESFPPALLTDGNGNNVEPLAADIRGETKKERNTKFKTEILRLIAPILGCSYDDLKQRHRERIIKRTISLVSAGALVVAIAGAAFGIYNAKVAERMEKLANEKAALADEKTRLADEVTAEYYEKQKNQSRFLAKEALQLLSEGKRQDAYLVAKEALPDSNFYPDGITKERPFVPEAEHALSEILHTYDLGRDMAFDRTLSHRLTLEDIEMSKDDTLLITRDFGSNVYVWDTKNWQMKVLIEPAVGSNNYLETVEYANADSSGVYVVCEKTFNKYGFDGELIYSTETSNYVKEGYVDSELGLGFCVANNTVDVVDLTSGEIKETLEVPEDQVFYSKVDTTSDGLFLCTVCDTESDKVGLGVFDIEGKNRIISNVSETYVLEYYYTPSGHLAVLSTNDDFVLEGVRGLWLDLLDPETGKILWSKEIPNRVSMVATFDAHLKARQFTDDLGVDNKQIVVTIESDAYCIDENDGSVISTLTLPAEAISLNLRSDNEFGFVGYTNGNVDTIDFTEGRIYPDNVITTDLPIRELIIANHMVMIRAASSSDVYVLKYHEKEDVKVVTENAKGETIKAAPLYGDWFVTSNEGSYKFYDFTGKVLYTHDKCDGYATGETFFGDKFVIWETDRLWIIDPATWTDEELVYSDMGLEGDESYFDILATDDGRYNVLWRSRNVAVLDLEERKFVLEAEAANIIGNVEIAPHGDFLYISEPENGLAQIRISDKEEKDFGNENLKALSDLSHLQYLRLSHDGTKIAMACSDGVLRIVNTSSFTVTEELPFYAKLKCSIFFTDEDRFLVYQGDDLKVKIYDVKNKSIVYTFDAGASISHYVGSDWLALCDGYDIYLLTNNIHTPVDPAEFGLLASPEYASLYVPTEDGGGFFLMKRGYTIYKADYKDYRALLEDAKFEFPGAELTAEDRVKYNLD
ncbi:MAG: TIR domain-containing protein [Lachnospiraceae bacterium]|nr:TIR domain-containing protein [Lachnospiraceae bacterium]